MIAAGTAGRAPARFPLPAHVRLPLGVPILCAALWIASFQALRWLQHWADRSGGQALAEVQFWESARASVVNAASLAVLTSVHSPVLLGIALIAGSAGHAAALVGATGLVLAALALRGLGATRWLLVFALQPALLASAAWSPTWFVQGMLLLVAMVAILAYARDSVTFHILIAGLALGAASLVNPHAWPLWIYLTVAVVCTRSRPLGEQYSLALVTLFPGAFLSLAWSAIQWLGRDVALIASPPWPFDGNPPSSTSPGMDTMGDLLATPVTAIPDPVFYLAVSGALLLAMLILSSRRMSSRPEASSASSRRVGGVSTVLVRYRLGVGLVLLAPVFAVIAPSGGHGSFPWAFSATLVLLAATLQVQRLELANFVRGLTGVVLLIWGFARWTFLLAG